MKFFSNGPDIPNSLMWERDAGRVVFICGAGVSMQEANLPSFSELASTIMDELLVPQGDVNRKQLEMIQSHGASNEMSIDRIFSRLEKEYHLSDIEDIVTKILSPSSFENTICHKIISDLATTPKGDLRLITTNFDDLFSRASGQDGHVYPDFPKVNKRRKLSELIYLHGKCSETNGSKVGNFVLSSRSFGKAYLSPGYASDFLKSVFENYTVVFVGYSSDDPPVQYLLDALVQPETSQYSVFAFQKGNDNVSEERWKERGVVPITYERHDYLWKTLGAWWRQVYDRKKWIESVLTKASIGPYLLADWERSQVAYLASSKDGALEIANQEPPLPSEWLFCFDPKFRYAANSTVKSLLTRRPEYIDPFEMLGLTSDIPPTSSPEDAGNFHIVPSNAWNAFDESTQTESYITRTSRSARSINRSSLSIRQIHLAQWIGKIYDQGSTQLWALYGHNLDFKFKRKIKREITDQHKKNKEKICSEWNLIFENWEKLYKDREDSLKPLQDFVSAHGWKPFLVRKYKLLSRPSLTIRENSRFFAISHFGEDPPTIYSLSSLDTRCGLSSDALLKSQNYITSLIRADRENLDFTIDYKKLNGSYDEWNLPNLVTLKQIDFSKSSHSNYSPVFYYLVRLIDLIGSNRSSAISQYRSWPRNDNNIFARLRIWAASRSDFLSDKDAGEVFLTLPQEVFWGKQHESDLKNALAYRWNKIPTGIMSKIENRILTGDEKREGETESDYEERRATLSVGLWKWLDDKKCNISDNFIQKMTSVQNSFSSSFPMQSLAANQLLEAMRGSSNKSAHIDVKIDDAIDFCNRGSAQSISSLEAVLRFHALYESRGISWILSALRRKTDQGVCSIWIWARALTYIREERWSAWHTIYVSNLINRTSNSVFNDNYVIFIDWFKEASFQLSDDLFDIRNRIFNRSYEVIKSNGDFCATVYSPAISRDLMWISGRHQSQSGQLAEALLSYVEVTSIADSISLPGFWLDNAYNLMSLKGINGCFALYCFARKIQWFFIHAEEWTKHYLLSTASSPEPLVREAFWTGISDREEKYFSFDLFQKIKTSLLETLSGSHYLNSKCQCNLADLTLTGWGMRQGGRRWISSNEFSWSLGNGTDVIRLHVLKEVDKRLEEQRICAHEVENFFLNVWPKSRATKSSSVISTMVGIATSRSSEFPQLVKAIVSRLGEVKDSGDLMHDILTKYGHNLKGCPETFFDIVVKVLPSKGSITNKSTLEILERLKNASSSVQEDDRFKKLMDRCITR